LLPIDKGFTFFYEFARPTQWTVYSLEEFESALKVVDVKSIEFHTERGDFERWIRQVIGDNQLAEELEVLSREKLKDENLRKRMLDVVKRRIRSLKQQSK
jgi:hypothetical protein